MKNKFIIYTFFILALSTFTSLMVKWQFSPYLFFVKDLKKNIALVTHPSFINTTELTFEINNSKDRNFGSLANLNNTKNTESIMLNNFNFHWGKVKAKDLRKIGAAELRGENIWYVNQDDYHLINKLGLDNKITSNGGIKSIFSINNKSYVYIAYVDGVCATARLVDLASMKIALQLSCLPDAENADLNAVGGGWLKLSNNTVLLFNRNTNYGKCRS